MQFDLSGPGVSLVTNMTNGEDSRGLVRRDVPDERRLHLPRRLPAELAGPDVRHIERNGPDVDNPRSPRALVAQTKGTTRPRSTRRRHRRLREAADGPLPRDSRRSGQPVREARAHVGGKKVGVLKAGEYTLEVTDHSKKAGFNLQEVRRGGEAVTATRFVGTKSVKVDLKAGQWFVYPTFLGKKTFFVVTT